MSQDIMKKKKSYFQQTSEIRSDSAMTAEAFMWQLSLCALRPEIAVGYMTCCPFSTLWSSDLTPSCSASAGRLIGCERDTADCRLPYREEDDAGGLHGVLRGQHDPAVVNPAVEIGIRRAAHGEVPLKEVVLQEENGEILTSENVAAQKQRTNIVLFLTSSCLIGSLKPPGKSDSFPFKIPYYAKMHFTNVSAQ